jgi:hypothetical protein
LVLIYDVWKCILIMSNGVNFAKDYQKDWYNGEKIIEKIIDDNKILTIVKKHS